ncbi:hypothetical protein ZWY2020_047465 [Hordeum vulgare]|nr:hypothetical protein ZWY2020_047465 [Hordeum vulgare]
MDNAEVVIVNRVLELQAQYLKRGEEKVLLDNIVTMMKNDETEEGFIRSFMFLFISTVFCATTQNYANWKLLYGIHDITHLKTFDLAQLCIDHLNKEIDNFSTKLLNRTEVPSNNSIFVGGCLPLADIVYVDFVDFTKASKQANINYGVPRMAHIQNEDFDYLTSVDLSRASKKPFALGFLSLKDISRTPESARAIILAEEKLSKAPQTFHNQEDQSIPQTYNFASTSNNNAEQQNPIILLSEVRRRNIISEPVNTNANPVHASTDPIIEELFKDDLGVSPTPNVSQVRFPTEVSKQAEETVEALSPKNNGNVSELVQTKESKLEEKVNANITPSMHMQKQLDIVHNGRDTEPNQRCFPNVNTPMEIIPQFRQVVAYKLAKSDINEEEFHGVQEDVSTKKRKKHC